jgi:hypothetical protein
VAVVSSMAAGISGVSGARESALDELASFRQAMYGCLWRRADALFELADAVLRDVLVAARKAA